MFDKFFMYHPEMNEALQKFQAQTKAAYDFWLDVMADTVKMYKAK